MTVHNRRQADGPSHYREPLAKRSPVERGGGWRVYPIMSLQIFFWVAFLIALLFSAYQNRANFPGWAGGTLIWFLLIGILGYAVFGAMVKH